MKKLILFGIFATLGCACSTTSHSPIFASNKLVPIVNQFFRDCRKHLGDDKCTLDAPLYVSIKEIPEENVLGWCMVYDNPSVQKRVIELRPEVAEGYQLWNVLYHELFHCVLLRPHFDDEPDIMNSYETLEVTQQIYSNWESFVQRAFQRE